MSEPFFYVFAALIGACLGSFANVVALRSLDGRDWARSRSRCFACRQPLRFWQNLPIYGFLRHGGHTACCQKLLPRRYLYVELAMAALAMIGWHQLSLPVLAAFAPFIVLLVVIFLTDMDAFIIPDRASLGGAALGLALAAFGTPGLPPLVDAITGGVVGFALIYGINFTYKIVRGRDGLGFGDVKLMAMFGVWLGPLALLPILFSASMAGAVIGIGIVAILPRRTSTTKQLHKQPQGQLPFGCFLAPMALVWLFFASVALRGF